MPLVANAGIAALVPWLVAAGTAAIAIVDLAVVHALVGPSCDWHAPMLHGVQAVCVAATAALTALAWRLRRRADADDEGPTADEEYLAARGIAGASSRRAVVAAASFWISAWFTILAVVLWVVVAALSPCDV